MLLVLAAGSLRPAVDRLTAADPGVEVVYANARELADRIAAGEPADVFLSASPADPERLHRAGLASAPWPFARNRLVVAVPAGSEATAPEVLAAPGVRVVVEHAGIPLGDFTRDALERMGIAEDVARNVVLEASMVDEVVAALRDGRADAGVLYATDVRAAGGALRGFELPAAAAVTTSCVACAVVGSRRLGASEAWLTDLVGPAGRAALEAAGFALPG